MNMCPHACAMCNSSETIFTRERAESKYPEDAMGGAHYCLQ